MRDTRGTQLSDADRMNFFPASPLFTVTVTLVGQLQIAPRIMPLDALHDLPVAPRHLFMLPQSTPQTSLNAGPVCALIIAFFPDAWQRLGGALDGTPPDLLHAPLSLLEGFPLAEAWPKFWDALACLWTQSAGKRQAADWRGSDRLKDWTYHLLGQLAQTGAGRGARSAHGATAAGALDRHESPDAGIFRQGRGSAQARHDRAGDHACRAGC
ncbi:hypothetical protein ABMC88_03195 [Sulfitobacter sp. HNIBRBA2951]|uniref:hypothetical protein n=1 Tax=Sulfitobacter aquimarinus TaxID=3158557 RepID=UPI0032DEADB5